MKGNHFDQLEVELDTETREAIKPKDAEEQVEKPTRKPVTKTSELETLQIEELYSKPDEDDDEDLIVPRAEIFNKHNISTNTTDYVATFHGSDADNAEEVKVTEDFKNNSKDDEEFISSFGVGVPIVTNGDKSNSSADMEALQSDVHSDYYEYTDRQQRKEIVGMYKYAKKNIKIKTIIASVFAVLLFFIENIGIFVQNPTGIFANPYVIIASSFVCLVVCGALAYEQLYHGIRSIFRKDYIPESVAVVASICAIVHTIMMLISVLLSNENNVPQLFNFPVAFIIVYVLLYSYLNVSREKYGFSIVCTKDIKFYLEMLDNEEAEAENETFSGTSGDFEGEVARVNKTGFIKNYFANTNAMPNLHSFLGIYYTLALLIPAIFAIISLFVTPDFFNAVSVWYIGALLMLPVGILFSYSVPFLISNKRLYEEEVTIIGENAITEFANADVVSVNDTTVFPPYNVKLTNFQVYNGFKTEKILYYAASGFASVGGPLAHVFDSATKDAFQKSKKAKFVCSGRSYLCINVDGDTIIFADRYGMSAQGIDVGPDKDDDDELSVMYMACNSSLCAKIYLRYTMDKDFAEIAEFLNKNKIGIGIRSFDPNINNELIKMQITHKKADIKVIRLTQEEEVASATARNEGKIVTKGPSKSLLKAVPMCKKIVKNRKVLGGLKIFSSVMGALLLGLSIFGKLVIGFSAIVVGYYIALIALMLCVTFVMIPSLK